MQLNPIIAIPVVLFLLLSPNSGNEEILQIEAYSSYNTSPLPETITVNHVITPYDSLIHQAQATIGLPGSDIEIETTTEDGAYSVINRLNHRRFFIYNPTYFEKVHQVGQGDFPVLSICFHELAHLYYQHPLKPSSESKMYEKQADRYSGFAMCLAGATLDQSLIAMSTFGNDLETSTHPGKNERLGDITEGYIDAKVHVFRDPNYIRADSIRNINLFALNRTTLTLRSGKQSLATDEWPRATKKIIKSSQPIYNMLGELIFFSDKGEVINAAQKVLGKIQPSIADGSQPFEIGGVKYSLKDETIYAAGPKGYALVTGQRVK